MGCIPLNNFDKHSLESRFFLNALGIGEKPQCNDFEKVLIGGLKALSAVLEFIDIPFVGNILNTAFREVILTEIKNKVKLDLKQLDKYFETVSVEWNKLTHDTRRHVIWNGFGTFAWDEKDTYRRIAESDFTKDQLNWLYFMLSGLEGLRNGKQFHDPFVSVVPIKSRSTGKLINNQYSLNWAMNLQQDRFSAETVAKFKRVGWHIVELINKTNITNSDAIKNQEISESKTNKLGVVASVLGLVLAFKK